MQSKSSKQKMGAPRIEQGLEQMVRLPSKLTAENGAKSLLIGEFYETVDEISGEI